MIASVASLRSLVSNDRNDWSITPKYAFDCDLVDLSATMLERARQRITAVNKKTTRIIQGDFRTTNLNPPYDVIIAAAVLHHLRDDGDWENAFARIYSLTAPGGSVWITDLIKHETDAVQSFIWKRYGDHLTALQDQDYRDEVFAYIDKEDSPRSVIYQLDLLRRVGFKHVEILHKNGPCAAFGAIKEG
jgi:tRNA (cmo5U34)-methyltransferase